MPDNINSDRSSDLSRSNDAPYAGLAVAAGPASDPLKGANGIADQSLTGVVYMPSVHLRDPEGEMPSAIVRPGSTELPSEKDLGNKYRIDGEIARGGMGAILKGRDTHLGRDIAVKVLLESHQGKPDLAQRFVEEAQIAGQLQHPGVVPVYELGVFADKRPYFTMKLVKGKTLSAMLDARANLADDRAIFIGIFAQVCQTLAYAHARGVIHRDLKPSNVMVGNFGEVQVMDWGLAKVLEEGGIADEKRTHQRQEVSIIRTQRSEGSNTPEVGSMTQFGSVLGTPAYMAPEQARGDLDLVDARADVFGLGAILCEILTGQPPFTGKGAEAMRKAQTANLDDCYARLDGCGADTELIGLAKHCLAAEPWDRPRNAGILSEAVTEYKNSVAQRMHDAELSSVEAKAKAIEERKRRKVIIALAGSVLAFVGVAAAGGLWVQQLKAGRHAETVRRELEQRHEVESALVKVVGLQQAARWKEADAILGQASARLGESGPDDLRKQIAQHQTDLTFVAKLDSIRQKRATVSGGYFDTEAADRDYGEAFQDAGIIQDGNNEDVVANRIRESAVKDQIVAALDDWANAGADLKRRAWLLGVARKADPDPWRDRLRDPKAWEDRGALERLAAELLEDDAKKLSNLSPHLLTALGNALMRMKADAVPLFKAAHARYSSDFWLNLRIGKALGKKGLVDSIGYSRATVALRPDSEVAHNNLGASLFFLGNQDDAIKEFRIAIALSTGYATPHGNLANVLSTKKQFDAAIEEYRTAIRLDSKHAGYHSGLADSLFGNGQFDEAIKECHAALALDPKSDLAYVILGRTLSAKGQLDEAITAFYKAVELDPNDAGCHTYLGIALIDKGQLDEAINAHRKATTLDPKDDAAKTNLGNALHRKGLLNEAMKEYYSAIALNPKNATAHYNLGVALTARRQLNEAIREFREAIAIHPKNTVAYHNLGNVLADTNQLNEAVKAYRSALELDPKSAAIRDNLGIALSRLNGLEESIKEFRAAIALDPKFAQPHANLGIQFARNNQHDEAIKEFRTAIAKDGKSAEFHFILGNSLIAKTLSNEAIREYRTAVELDPKHAAARVGLGLALAITNQIDEAVREYRAAIELQPDNAMAHYGLGLALESLGRYNEALLEMRKGHELGTKQPGWRFPSEQSVRTTERLVGLERRLPEILSGQDKPANNDERLLLAHICQIHKKLNAVATRFYTEAFANDSKLLEDMQSQHRYNAACAAAMAAAGNGLDAWNLTPEQRSKLRKQALDWLRADLAAWAKTMEKDNAKARAVVHQTMQHWQKDSDLAGLRDKDAVAKLSDAERATCEKLWADVAALLKQDK